MFGCAVIRSFFQIVESIKEEDNAASICGSISVFVCMAVSYIWFLNLITK
jgi:hypothetical protein